MFEIKPKTRKEIYMAYLAGDMSLELPEPLTRDEVTLYNLCQSHAYGSTTTVKEVLAECQPEFVADIGGFMLAGDFPIVAGETYIVNWNGKDYPCVSALISGDSSSGEIGFGNASAGGGEDSGEPFLVDYQYSDRTENNGLAIIPLDGSTTLTISIRQEVTEVQKISGKYVEGMGYEEDGVIHPIDPKFLPSGGGAGGGVFYITNSIADFDKTVDELVEAYNSGKTLVLRMDAEDGQATLDAYQFFPLIKCDIEYKQFIFGGMTMISSSGKCTFLTVEIAADGIYHNEIRLTGTLVEE